ncbi:unnamed protein product [Enterobius vermicularis]|uniref:Nuclear receptor domain-containing protein n=1 Tax=Enterobius vermicularis TaxID=51028 RepID=A0A158QAV6_ENTVE|nr:unnamed protein product [Enterobius vermicularis]
MSEKLPPGTLCVVCQDLATGNHYSIPSCNGCKTFFRRAVVKNRTFACMGNGNCPISKGGRCACRHCRFKKCLEVGMDRNSIQNDRDRIGYTKRTRKRKADKVSVSEKKQKTSSLAPNLTGQLTGYMPVNHINLKFLENNFTLLLSRGRIEPYGSLDHALASPSLFNQPIEVKVLFKTPHLPFWRSRIIALYIDWAKTFPAFKNLPYSDKVALITNHASSYMVMCEAFRTPEHNENKILNTGGFAENPYEGTNSLLYCAKNSCADLDAFQNGVIADRMKTEATVTKPKLMGTKSGEVEVLKDRSQANTICDYSGPSFYDGCGGNPSSTSSRPSAAHCASLTGLTPVLTAMIDYVMKPFRRLNISTTEFAVLQAIMFFDPDTDGLDSASQRNVTAEQKKLLAALYRYICAHYEASEADGRYAAILLCIPTIRKVAAKKNESLQIIDMFKIFELNSLLKETALGIRLPNAASSCITY